MKTTITGLVLWCILNMTAVYADQLHDDIAQFMKIDVEPTVLFMEQASQLRQILALNITYSGGGWAGGKPIPRRTRTDGGHTCIIGSSPFGKSVEVAGWELFCVKPGQIKLKIFRPQGEHMNLIAESRMEHMKNGFNRFSLPQTIAVNKGDLLGFFLPSGSAVAEDPGGGDFYHQNGEVTQAVTRNADWFHSQAVSSVRAFSKDYLPLLEKIDQTLARTKITIKSDRHNYSVPWSKLKSEGETRFLAIKPVEKSTPVTLTLVEGGRQLAHINLEVKPEKKWKIYLFHSIHIDIGYTNPQEVVAQRLVDNLDKLMSYHENNNALIRELKPVWNCEVAWVIDEYQRRRSPQQFERLISHLKKGNITAQALFCNILSGLYGSEDLVRLLYFTAGLKHHYGVPVLSAKQTDTPNYTYALPSILANAGIKYFSLGQNRQVAGRRPPVCPFYWVGPDGSEVLVWHSQGYYRSGGAGGSWRHIQDRIRVAEQESDICDAVGYHGLHGDNASFRPERYEHYLNLVKSWNRRWAYPKIIIGTPYDMLSYVEKNFGPKLPRIKGDWGCDWEDGAASSAYETGINRRAKNLLHTGEALAVITASVSPRYTYPRKQINETFRNALLYDEHTWGSGESVSDPEGEDTQKQWAVKSAFANDALKGADSLVSQALDALAGEIPTGDQASILVYNPLSWVRTDVAVISLPKSLRNNKAIEVIDLANNQPVTSQREGDNLVFLARDVPSLGYKCFQLKEVNWQLSCSIACDGNIIENKYFRITLDPQTGAVAGIFDKELNRELVDQASPYRFNQYVYDDDGVREMQYRRKGKEPPTGGKHGPQQIAIKRGIIGPVRGSIVSIASARMTPQIEQEIILYSDIKRIDLVNHLKKDLTYEVEQVYYAFPFAVDKPEYTCELGGSIISATKDRLDCADKNWFAIQNWVDISNEDYGITWVSREAPLVEFVDIHDRWVDKLVPANGSLFSYIMNNVWVTNYKGGQGGDFTFHYAMTGHQGRTDRCRATRFGAEMANPLLCHFLSPARKGKLPFKLCSFCKIDSNSVVIQCLKRAEDDRGLIVRLREVGGKDTTVKLSLPYFSFERVLTTNLVEEDIKPLQPGGKTVQFGIKANSMATIRCW